MNRYFLFSPTQVRESPRLPMPFCFTALAVKRRVAVMAQSRDASLAG